MLLLFLADEWIINAVRHDDRILSVCLEHVDVLALLFLICYIVDLVLMTFLFRLIHTVFQRQIFSVQILVNDVVIHLLSKFLIL